MNCDLHSYAQEQAMPTELHSTAWDFIGTEHLVRIVGGRSVYEDVVFNDDSRQRQVRLARLTQSEYGLHQINRYVDPDTPMEIAPECRCTTCWPERTAVA